MTAGNSCHSHIIVIILSTLFDILLLLYLCFVLTAVAFAFATTCWWIKIYIYRVSTNYGQLLRLREQYCDQRVVCLFVYLRVCLSVRSHIPNTRCLNFTKFSVHISSDRGSVVLWRQCNTLCTSGLWMTSCFRIIGQIRTQTWSLRRSELLAVTRQATLLNCAPGAKFVILECLVEFCESQQKGARAWEKQKF